MKGETFKTYTQIPTCLACDNFEITLNGNNITFYADSVIIWQNNGFIQMSHI